MSFARASTWLGDRPNTSVPSCFRSCLSQRAVALAPSGHDDANATDGRRRAAAPRAAAALFLRILSRGYVRHVRKHFRLVGQLGLRLIAALSADADGLALLRLRRSDDLDVDLAFAVVRPTDIGLRHLDGRTGLHLGPQHRIGERVLDVALDRATQRPRTHRRIEALLDQEVLRVVVEVERQLALRHRLPDPPQQQVDDLLDLVLLQLVEDDYLVDAVQE